MRTQALEQYAAVLGKHPSLWTVAVTYMVTNINESARPDFASLSAMLIRVVNAKPTAHNVAKVLHVCESLRLPALHAELCAHVGRIAANANRSLVALLWFTRAKVGSSQSRHHLLPQDPIAATQQIDALLREFLETGAFPPAEAIEPFTPAQSLCKRMFFLGLACAMQPH